MDGHISSPEAALAAVGATVTPHRPKAAGRFQVRAFDQCRLDHAGRYIIKGVLAPGDLALIFGQPGCGKSLLGPLLAHAVAEGRWIFGRRTRKLRVLYIAAEAGADMEVRFVALREQHGDVDHLHLIADTIDLRNPEEERALKAVIAQLRPDLIFVDTLAAAFPGLEENEAKDMGRAVAALRALGEPSGAAVVAIHHAPKEGLTPRGHGILNGACDVTMRVDAPGEEEPDGPRRVTFGKNRNGPSGHAFTFGMELVELGTDADGDTIRRPVAVEIDREETPTPRGRRLTETQEGWLRDLTDMFAEPGLATENVPVLGMKSLLTATRTQVREGFRVRGRFETNPHGGLTDLDRRRLSDNLNALRDKGKIGLTADLVWLL